MNATGVPPRRRGHAAFGTHRHTLVVGMGYDVADGLRDDVFALDMATFQWTRIVASHSVYNPSLPHARAWAASTLLASMELMAIGGCVKLVASHKTVTNQTRSVPV